MARHEPVPRCSGFRQPHLVQLHLDRVHRPVVLPPLLPHALLVLLQLAVFHAGGEQLLPPHGRGVLHRHLPQVPPELRQLLLLPLQPLCVLRRVGQRGRHGGLQPRHALVVLPPLDAHAALVLRRRACVQRAVSDFEPSALPLQLRDLQLPSGLQPVAVRCRDLCVAVAVARQLRLEAPHRLAVLRRLPRYGDRFVRLALPAVLPH